MSAPLIAQSVKQMIDGAFAFDCQSYRAVEQRHAQSTPLSRRQLPWRLAMRRAGFKKGWANRIRCWATKRDGTPRTAAGDGQRRRARLRLSRRVCSGGEEGTAQPNAQVPDVPGAQKTSKTPISNTIPPAGLSRSREFPAVTLPSLYGTTPLAISTVILIGRSPAA